MDRTGSKESRYHLASQAKLIPVILIILSCLGSLPIPAFGDVSISTYTVSEDSYVDEDNPNSPYSNESRLETGWATTKFDSSRIDSPNVMEVISYMKFDIGAIPNSNFSRDVSINSAKVKIFVQTAWGVNSTEKAMITISYCDDNEWSEMTINWNNRPCKNQGDLVASDSIIFRSSDLPSIFYLDVKEPLDKARNSNSKVVTYVIRSTSLIDNYLIQDDLDSRPLSAHVVALTSKESGNVHGSSFSPSLVIEYSVEPSILASWNDVILVEVLPALAIVVSALAGFKTWLKKRKAKKLKQQNKQNDGSLSRSLK